MKMSCFGCYSSRRIDSRVIEEVLERGQQLRNAIVQSILANDPLNLEIINSERKPVKIDDLSEEINSKVRSFLQGDEMSREEEFQALETLRSMSVDDLCKATDRTYRSQESCECSTCLQYKSETKSVKQTVGRCENENLKYLEFVDSFKVYVNSVVLNEAGEKKVSGSTIKDRRSTVEQIFFLEYQISGSFSKTLKNKGKVDSGLDSGGVVRLCARRGHLQAISFKQISIHDIDLSKGSLEDAVITFKLSFRNFKQKQPIILGIATFNFSSFEISKNFNCTQELALKLSNSPIVVGAIRISVQLGCGKLYFGREFLDAITNNKENSIYLASDDLSSPGSIEKVIDLYTPIPKLKLSATVPEKSKKTTSLRNVTQNKKPILTKREPEVEKVVPQESSTILFGFIGISEAQFNREVLNSFLKCQTFLPGEFCISKVVTFDSNPFYNFSQQVPVVFDEDFLLRLRENFLVVEFFEKGEKDFLIGLTRIHLQQLYLSYRNPVIAKYLTERHFPVISSDGWENIYKPDNDEIVGKVQILVALGTKEQIDNLEKERGFTKTPTKIKTPKPTKKTDVGIQSEMEPKKDIESFISEMMAQKGRPLQVETGTNTELRSTAALLDSLQLALSVDKEQNVKDCFKARVLINSALHLPSRKKCKSKKSKGRHEDILPSTYVTFEDYKADLKMTHIIPKSTSPKWEYTCDVYLPISYLSDSQKFLVFKVWRKSTNTTMTPNMQVDHVIGFSTVDLTVLAAGLPTVQGWYNINDLSKKCNGQINIHITPLENVSSCQPQCCSTTTPTSPAPSTDSETGELLGRALKRKFTELDEITQRLRLRLSKVTNDESDTSNDEIADEFERDINTLCVEDDFDLVDFEKEARNFNLKRNKEVGLLQTGENKQKLDQMLQQLSLAQGEGASRYISGCSDSNIESLLNDLDAESRPNLYTDNAFSKEMTLKFAHVLEEGREVPEGEGSDLTDLTE